MPRNPSGVYTKPYPNVVTGTTIESAVHNGTVSDIETDLNFPRPVVAGGTGSSTAAGALTNLGGVALAGDTMTGNLTITKVSPAIIVNKTGQQDAVLSGQLNGVNRWQVAVGNSFAESGGNAGSDFEIYRFNDAGALQPPTFSIKRSTGNVGIGTQSPAAQLSLGNPQTDANVRTYTNNDQGIFAFYQAANYPSAGSYNRILDICAGGLNSGGHIRFLTQALNAASVEAMHITPTSLVGIGTPTPETLLHVRGPTSQLTMELTNATTGVAQILFKESGTLKGAVDLTGSGIGTGANQLRILTTGITPITFSTNSNERMRIRDDGAIIIPNTGKFDCGAGGLPFAHLASFSRYEASTNVGLMTLVNPAAVSGNIGIYFGLGPNASDTNSIYCRFFDAGFNAQQGYIIRSGAAAVQFVSASDGRLKTKRELYNQQTAREVIDALEVYNLDFAENLIQGVGLIAQQAYEVHKQLAIPPMNGDSEKLDMKDLWGMEKAAPMPFVIANLQQLNARIDLIEAQLAMSESKPA